MDRSRFTLALPDDPDLVARLSAALARQSAPPITIGPSRTAVLDFEADTGEIMLRSRVIQALESAVGPDWQQLVRPVG